MLADGFFSVSRVHRPGKTCLPISDTPSKGSFSIFASENNAGLELRWGECAPCPESNEFSSSMKLKESADIRGDTMPSTFNTRIFKQVEIMVF